MVHWLNAPPHLFRTIVVHCSSPVEKPEVGSIMSFEQPVQVSMLRGNRRNTDALENSKRVVQKIYNNCWVNVVEINLVENWLNNNMIG